MRYCEHTQWLSIARKDGEITLQNTDRLKTILEDLPEPDEQRPSLLLFIGNKSKSMAMKELAKSVSDTIEYSRHLTRVSGNPKFEVRSKLAGRRAFGEIHLHLQTSSAFSGRPILLAEGDFPSSDKTKQLQNEACHEVESRPLRGLCETPSASADVIYSRLLSPFADVICIFADDVGGFEPIVKHMAFWMDLGHPSTLDRSTRPQVLIITGSHNGQGDNDQQTKAFEALLRHETTLDFVEHFSAVRVLSLPWRSKNLSDTSRHRLLFENLLKSSDEVRKQRSNSKFLFLAADFASFFQCALIHVSTKSFFNRGRRVKW